VHDQKPPAVDQVAAHLEEVVSLLMSGCTRDPGDDNRSDKEDPERPPPGQTGGRNS
jgi:hypothetical protein